MSNETADTEELESDFQQVEHKPLKLTAIQKKAVKEKRLLPSGRRFRFGRQILLDSAIEEYQHRAAAQEGTEKPRPRGNAATPQNRRRDYTYPQNQIEPPSDAVRDYLQHLQSVKPNAYAIRLRKAKEDKLGMDQLEVLAKLDPVPLYSLRHSNRIFCTGQWQTLRKRNVGDGKELRQKVFSGCINADFRSMHFEIFRMLLQKHAPIIGTDLDQLLDGKGVWDFMRLATDGKIEKDVFKVAVQALLNGSSKKRTKERFELDEEQIDVLSSTNTQPRAFKILESAALRTFIELVYRGVKSLSDAIERGVHDAFDQPLIPLTVESYRKIRKENSRLSPPKWKLKRKDLNRLYSSYELKIMSETVRPLLGREEFRVDMHLHDGILFSANKKTIGKVIMSLKQASEEILSTLQIGSQIEFEEVGS